MLRFLKKDKNLKNTFSDPVVEFLQDYETEEQELTILLKEFTKGGMVRGDFIFPVVSFLAYIDRETGKAVQDRGTLCWVTRRSFGHNKHNFKDYGIYTVLVRKLRPDILNPLGKPFKNRFHLIKILQKNVKEPQLEAIRNEYLRPVSIQDEAGIFHLNRQYDWFEGEINWQGNTERVLLDTDENQDTANFALKTLHLLLSDPEKWDRMLRKYAADKLTGLANDWQSDEATPEITKKDFEDRIGNPAFHFDHYGCFEAEYNDDDMFFGHWIVVHGNSDGEITDANIEG